jgi:AcrR family transcriptional regulator
MDSRGSGLREIKKQMTRESIAEAAFKLVIDKGLDHVTIEEIAQEAFISPRTVSNYFSCKEEAVVAAGSHDWPTIIENFERRPADEDPLHALSEIFVDYANTQTRQQSRLRAQKLELTETYPSLRRFQIAEYDQFEDELRTVIAARTGTQVDTDMYPSLAAAAAVSVIKSATNVWVRSGADPEQLAALFAEAFAQLSAGLPSPTRRRPKHSPKPVTLAARSDAS